MQLVIDISERDKERITDIFNTDNYVPANIESKMLMAIARSTSLEDTKKQNYNQGFYDGYSKATEQANVCIDKIKEEIEKEQRQGFQRNRKTYDVCLNIIDKYTKDNIGEMK